jgi:hypothetical protein
MFAFRFRSHFGWIAFAYAAVIALVLYPALHESLGPQLTLWNCIPPTLGLIVITSALGKSRRRVIVSATFALLAAVLTIFFAGAWVFTPLDTDPHSSMTAIAFAFAPVWSLLVAIIGSGLTWFAIRARSKRA